MSVMLEKAIRDLETIPELQNADFINLQEAIGSRGGINGNTVETIAKRLKMNYVFAPGCVLMGNDYGNAILSRWPISDFRKTLLPRSDHLNQRIALGATASLNGRIIQVYSIHLSVLFKDSATNDNGRTQQVETALDAIDQLPKFPTFLSGDFNGVNPISKKRINFLFEQRSFTAAPDKGWTIKTNHFTLDHAFVRDLHVVENGIAYTAQGSDHVPIWSWVKLTN